MTTAYHAKYFAHELTKRSPSGSIEKLAASLSDAQVDLNPHQVEAAVFAFRSPLSKGAILADEVGLGKTIEAGLVIAQKWAERKRRILIILPSNLRKQWSQELQEKFFLSSKILETKSFNAAIREGNLNPFDQNEVVICSYQFSHSKADYIKAIQWNLVVIDEAHRLRNVYKATNKIANSVKAAVAHAPKILLTATPLQNSLVELYGLVSIIDEYVFGDLKSFKAQFSKLTGDDNLQELKDRIKPVCLRTLRRQVLEYVNYTARIAIVEEFTPSQDEQRLYDQVTEYLQREELFALPKSQRKLITLILRKLLASSTFAIASTFERMKARLEAILATGCNKEGSDDEVLPQDFEGIEELLDEWEDETEPNNHPAPLPLSTEEILAIKDEIHSLSEFAQLARSILHNSKGQSLLTALRKGFTETEAKNGAGKAIIFTESTRTQNYLLRVLEATEYQGKIVLFNGSNNDAKSKAIYQAWLERNKDTDKITGSPTADKRAALVDYFRDEAVIMIATEAAAEGINLQFCSLVVNYDLPWNPQRIEQRIGRCHRYGQKNDVVVVNFLNRNNAADQRVYQLLASKFKLFSGVFGASDEVLGSVESGVDFEKRIAEIYQKCRTPEEIQASFDDLQSELEAEITEEIKNTRQKLLENFDEEVQEKLKISLKESEDVLNRYESWLWSLTRYFLGSRAKFAEEGLSFQLLENPFPGEAISEGPYRAGRNVQDAHVYRIGHPLAQRIMTACLNLPTPGVELQLDYSGSGKKISILAPLTGQRGTLTLRRLSIDSFEEEDHVLISAVTDSGQLLDDDQCVRLFSLPAEVAGEVQVQTPASLESSLSDRKGALLSGLEERNARYFENELEKLDRWGEDKRATLRFQIKELDDQIKDFRKAARSAPNLPEKLRLERERKSLEARRDEAFKQYDLAAKEIEAQKELLIDDVEKRLANKVVETVEFTVRWKMV